MEKIHETNGKAALLVDVIQRDLGVVLSAEDRKNVIQKVAMIRGTWRDKSVGELNAAAIRADEFYTSTNGLLPDKVMEMVKAALLSGITGMGIEPRRLQALKILHLSFAVIQAMERGRHEKSQHRS